RNALLGLADAGGWVALRVHGARPADVDAASGAGVADRSRAAHHAADLRATRHALLGGVVADSGGRAALRIHGAGTGGWLAVAVGGIAHVAAGALETADLGAPRDALSR